MSREKFVGRRRTVIFSLLFLVLLTLSGCKTGATSQTTTANKEGSFPVTITDDVKRQITLNTEPKRIVSLAPSNTEILYSLGLGERVVGVTTYCDYPEEANAVAKIGGYTDPSLEKIVALKPDLVLAADTHEQFIKPMQDAGLNVLVLKPNSIEDIFNDILMVGQAAGAESKAVAVTNELKKRVDAVEKKIAKVPDDQRPAVFYEMWYEPLMSVGKDSLAGQLIQTAGGKSITGDIAELYPQLSEEVIIEKNPNVLINSYGHEDQNAAPEQIASRKGWSNLAFVKDNRIYTIDTDYLTIPGPRIIDGLEKIAQCLYPDLFK